MGGILAARLEDGVRLSGLLCLLIVVLAPGEAAARWKNGPTLQLRVEGRFDSNLLEGGSDGSSLVQPGLGWKFASPTTTIDALYLFELVSYAHAGPGRGGVNQRALGGQHFELSRRTSLDLQQTFERAYDPTALSRAGVVRAPGTSTYGRADFDLAHRLAPTWSGGLRLSEEVAQLDAPSTIDGAVHAPAAWLSHAWSRRDSSRLQYRLQYFQSFGASDASSNEISASYRRTLTKSTIFEVEAGPAFYTAGGRTRALPWGRLSIDRVWPRFNLGLTLERSLFGSTGFEGALWGEGATGVLNWRIAEPLRATLALGVYRNGTAPDAPAFVQGFGGAAVLEYALGGDLVAQAAWRRVAQSGLLAGAPLAVDLSRNVFAVGVAWHLDGGRL